MTPPKLQKTFLTRTKIKINYNLLVQIVLFCFGNIISFHKSTVLCTYLENFQPYQESYHISKSSLLPGVYEQHLQ